jgi:NAD(P)H dehydrogenase (quinone)
MDLVIFAHPDNKNSHNAAILKHVTGRLKMKFAEFEVIDLYADNFDPVFRLTKEPEAKAAQVKKYQQLVAKADRLIFISPVWWYNLPAILKGFVEHVFHSGFAYSFKLASDNTHVLEQKLKGKSAIVINTYGRTKDDARRAGNPPELVLDKAVLEFCGVRVQSRVEWFEVKGPALLPRDIINRLDSVL